MPLKTMRESMPQMNMTPMIDIVFLLIIFLMLGTRYSELQDEERDLLVRVPQVSGTPDAPPRPRPRVIQVLADGTVELEGKTIAADELIRRLKSWREEDRNAAVVIRGDAAASHQAVAQVLAACRSAGISDVGISVRTARREP